MRYILLVLCGALSTSLPAAIIDGFDLPGAAVSFTLTPGSPTFNLATALGGGVNRDFTATYNGTGTVAGQLGAGSFSLTPAGGATPQVDIVYTFASPLDFSSLQGLQVLATYTDFFVPVRIRVDTTTGFLLQSGSTSAPAAGPYTFNVPFTSLIGPGNLNSVTGIHVVVGNSAAFFSTQFNIDAIQTVDAPEPATALLMLAPLALIAWRRR